MRRAACLWSPQLTASTAKEDFRNIPRGSGSCGGGSSGGLSRALSLHMGSVAEVAPDSGSDSAAMSSHWEQLGR